MQEYLDILNEMPIFSNIDDEKILSILKARGSKIQSYEKDEYVWMAGEKSNRIGIVLSGCVIVEKADFRGNRTIVAKVCEGDIFGETFSFMGLEKLPVNVIATTNCEVLTVDGDMLINSSSFDAAVHNQIIRNLLSIISKKNMALSSNLEHLSKRVTKEKIMSFLHEQSKIKNKKRFVISYNRQELADYLCVDRSALSKELCKLKAQGVIKFRKNRFEILNQNNDQSSTDVNKIPQHS